MVDNTAAGVAAKKVTFIERHPKLGKLLTKRLTK